MFPGNAIPWFDHMVYTTGGTMTGPGKSLPASDKFNLGRWEAPILAGAVVWLVFELALFRDSSFKEAWAYVIVMVIIGACYLGYLLATRGRHGLTMPGMQSIDAELEQEAEKH
jgi:hypothetical protein